MARLFVHDNKEYPDPDPRLGVDEVRKQMADFIPELANADTKEERRGEDTVYTFSRRIGTKGRDAGYSTRELVEAIRSVPPRRLLVMELAPLLFDERGDLRVEEAADRQPEINLAAAEVQAYARDTAAMTGVLRDLPAR
jgi:PRTRC genetic system protein C